MRKLSGEVRGRYATRSLPTRELWGRKIKRNMQILTFNPGCRLGGALVLKKLKVMCAGKIEKMKGELGSFRTSC
jgi:hypothetical protein